MSYEQRQLGQRAIACRHWRWLPGAVDDLGTRVIEVLSDGRLKTSDMVFVMHAGVSFPEPAIVHPHEMGWPEFSDVATLGCLRGLVREAWHGRDFRVWLDRHGRWCWSAQGTSCCGDYGYDTEVEALIGALAMAP